MIISCPHCQTRYQVTAEVIGSVGRKVQCAHCHRDWRALPQPDRPLPQPALQPETAPDPASERRPEDDRLFDQMTEDRLDEQFAEIERTGPAGTASPGTPKSNRTLEQALLASSHRPRRPAPSLVDPHALKARLKLFAERERTLLRQMPQERLRRTVRIAAGGALALLLAMLLAFRVSLVAGFPALAGLYAGLGLPVNVVGLDFADLRTLESLSAGAEKLVIDANIVSVTNTAVLVPSVIVTLTDNKGADIYEWSVPPPAARLDAGKSVAFETQLPLPPKAAAGVRLSFGPAATGADKPAQPPPAVRHGG